MVGRPLQFDPSAALDAATQVFWQHGYTLSSLQMLIEAMAISKSSFYQTFENKHSLFKQCLRHYCAQIISNFNVDFANANSGSEFIKGYFQVVVNETKQDSHKYGCLLHNTLNEFGQTDKGIAKIVNDGYGSLNELFFKAIKDEQSKGTISMHKDAQVIANFLLSNSHGLRSMLKSGADANTLQPIVDTIFLVFD